MHSTTRMSHFREIVAGLSVKVSVSTSVSINGVQSAPFQGTKYTCGPPPASPAFTRGAAAAASASPLDKETQTPRRIPVPSSAWRRRMNAKKALVNGGVFRLDGGKVDPALKRKYSLRKRRAPKRQFTKKPKPSKTPAPPRRHRVPLATRVALVDLPVGTSLSSRSGRVIRKKAQFDPSLLRSNIQSISRPNPEGLYSVCMLMTEEEVLQAGGVNVLNSFAKKAKK
jgi:hypothetical protein